MKISHDNIVKIADVGLAKAAGDITGTVVGTCIYMAPEVFHDDGQKYDSKADIYSLGLMLWEMWYGQQAFSDILTVDPQLTKEKLFELVDNGRRPKATKSCNKPPTAWEQLITQCWNENPDIRPTAAHCARKMIMQQMKMDPELDAVRIDYGVLKMEGEASNFGVGAFGPVYYQGTMKRQKDVQTGVTVELYEEDTVIEDVWTIMKLMWPLRLANPLNVRLSKSRCIKYYFKHLCYRPRGLYSLIWPYGKGMVFGVLRVEQGVFKTWNLERVGNVAIFCLHLCFPLD